MPRRLPLAVLLASIVAPFPLAAQIRASERASVSQTVDGTTIAIEYSRPQVRGRDSIFGGLEPWGKRWTPGANWATTFTSDRDVTLNGHAVPAGSYSVWFDVQPETWTVILDPEPRRFHLMPPPDADGQVRFAVRPEPSPHHEALTWLFTGFRATGTTLRFAWADRAATFDVGVEPSLDFAVTSAMVQRFAGDWLATVGGDTLDLTIRHDGEHMAADWEASPLPWVKPMWLLPLGEGMFHPVILEEGKPFDVITDLVLEFTPLEGRVTTFEVRGPGDVLMGTGRRVR